MFKDYQTKEKRLKRPVFNEITGETEETLGQFTKSYLMAFAWALVLFPFIWLTFLVAFTLIN